MPGVLVGFVVGGGLVGGGIAAASLGLGFLSAALIGAGSSFLARSVTRVLLGERQHGAQENVASTVGTLPVVYGSEWPR